MKKGQYSHVSLYALFLLSEKVLKSCDIQSHHLHCCTSQDKTSPIYTGSTRSTQRQSFPSHCPSAEANVGFGSPITNHEFIVRNGALYVAALTCRAGLCATTYLGVSTRYTQIGPEDGDRSQA